MLSQNVTDFITFRCEQNPYQKAVIFPESRDKSNRVSYTHLTYQQLYDGMNAFALGLQLSGITKGTRTVLMVKPSLEFFILSFALFRLGAIPVLIDPGLGLANIKRALQEANPDAFIGITKAHVARLILGWQRQKKMKLITVGPKLAWSGLTYDDILKLGQASQELLPPPPQAQDPAAILFTSGSTGSPKGALYTQANFLAQIEALKQAYQIKEGEIDLCTFPLFALFAPALSLTAVIPEMDFSKPAKVKPERIYEAIDNFGVNNMFGSPALLKTVAKDALQKQKFFPSLKRVVSAGAPVPPQTLIDFSKIMASDGEIFTPYGATEALPICSIGSREILAKTAAFTHKGHGVCVGKPVPSCQIFIIKITDEPITTWDESLKVAQGDIGEIVVSGPQVTSSYFGRPDADLLGKIKNFTTGQVLHRMGDIGYQDKEGRIWFCGRKSHRLTTKTGVMYTIPTEAIFNTHSMVQRTALVGIGPAHSQTPVLVVELEPGIRISSWPQIKKDLTSLALKYPHTSNIDKYLYQKSLPVDIRHNSKIFRERLRPIAEKEFHQ